MDLHTNQPWVNTDRIHRVQAMNNSNRKRFYIIMKSKESQDLNWQLYKFEESSMINVSQTNLITESMKDT